MNRDNYLGALEGLLFAVGEEGLSLEQMAHTLELGAVEILTLVGELRTRYEGEGYGFALVELAGVYKLVTKVGHAEFLKRLLNNPNQKTLSNAALEILAIIAYKQPITRHEIEAIRGVSNDQILKKLLAFSLIEEAGRLDAPGRPLLFQTTNAFLDYFGIKTIAELPKIEVESTDLDGEVDLFSLKRSVE